MSVKIVIYVKIPCNALPWNKKRVQKELFKIVWLSIRRVALILLLCGTGYFIVFKICLDEPFQFPVQFV
jgi:hypothetical protein